MSEVLVKDIHTEENSFQRRKHSGIFLLKIIIASGLLIYIVKTIKVKEIITGLSNADYYFILISFSLLSVNLFLQYLKWEIVCKEYLNITNKKKILVSLFHGFAAGIFTPARLGEYLSRGFIFKDKPILQIAAATFIDKFFPFLIVVFTGGISFIFYLNIFSGVPFYKSIYLFILFSAISIYLLWILFRVKSFNFIVNKLKKKRNFNSIIISVRQLKKLNFRFTLKMISISSGFYIIYIVQFAFLISAFTHNFRFIKYLWAGSLVMFAKTIIPQISIGEVGVRESTSIYFFSKIGEASSAAFNASILLFVINLVLPSLVGLVLLYKKSND